MGSFDLGLNTKDTRDTKVRPVGFLFVSLVSFVSTALHAVYAYAAPTMILRIRHGDEPCDG